MQLEGNPTDRRSYCGDAAIAGSVRFPDSGAHEGMSVRDATKGRS